MFCTLSFGQSEVQFAPPSVVFQMPPPETAAKALLGVKRSATTSVTRPPMLYGPICFQLIPFAAAGTSAAWACARLTIASVGLPYLSSSSASLGGICAALSCSGATTSFAGFRPCLGATVEPVSANAAIAPAATTGPIAPSANRARERLLVPRPSPPGSGGAASLTRSSSGAIGGGGGSSGSGFAARRRSKASSFIGGPPRRRVMHARSPPRLRALAGQRLGDGGG